MTTASRSGTRRTAQPTATVTSTVRATSATDPSAKPSASTRCRSVARALRTRYATSSAVPVASNSRIDSHQAISRPPMATPPRGCESCRCTNGVMTVSASSGPMSVRIALIAASSASNTSRSPITDFESPSADPTATVDGTSVTTAKNAISAAWPVVRWRLAFRSTPRTNCHGDACARSRGVVVGARMNRMGGSCQTVQAVRRNCEGWRATP